MAKHSPYYEPRIDEIRATAKSYGYKIFWKLERNLLKVTIKLDPTFVAASATIDYFSGKYHPTIWLQRYYKEVKLLHKNSRRSIYQVVDMWKVLRNV